AEGPAPPHSRSRNLLPHSPPEEHGGQIKISRNQQTQSPTSSSTSADSPSQSLPPSWEDDPNSTITAFSQMPHRFFGYNSRMKVNEDFEEALRQILCQFQAPIRYAFAYGSGVFGQKNTSGGGEGSTDLSL